VHHVWGGGGVASRILNVGTRQGTMVSFTPRLLYHQGKSPSPLHWIGGWLGCRMDLGSVEKVKSLPSTRIDFRGDQPVVYLCNKFPPTTCLNIFFVRVTVGHGINTTELTNISLMSVPLLPQHHYYHRTGDFSAACSP
jgi:hypothetical protein